MPVDVYPDEGRTVTVECRDTSHKPRVAKIATWQEELLTNGQRHSIVLLGARRTTRDGGADLVTHAQRHVEIGGGSGGRIARDRRPNTVTETLVYVDDDTPSVSAKGDLSRDRRFHYQLTCPLCGWSDSFRQERLYPVLGRLIDGGVSHIGLSRLGAIVSTLQ